MADEFLVPWYHATLTEATRVEFEGLYYDGGGLRIDLRELSGEKRPVSLVFEELPTALRVSNESTRLSSMSAVPDNNGHSFYTVGNSRFLGWLNAESLSIYSSDPIFHLVILTDEWIDIICNSSPTVKIGCSDGGS